MCQARARWLSLWRRRKYVGTFGVLLILFGITIAWLLGVKGLSVDQAIADVQNTLQVGQSA